MNLLPSGSGWAHELKDDGYRLQIHVRDSRVRLKVEGSAIIDAEVVWLDSYGMSNFEALYSRVNDAQSSRGYTD
jgi:ATP-dependent DNA ligase